jgi:hypothetical protein
MAQITLTQEEAIILRRALSSYVSDLSMEIAHTDSWQFRQTLKHEEVLLKKLLEKLGTKLTR